MCCISFTEKISVETTTSQNTQKKNSSSLQKALLQHGVATVPLRGGNASLRASAPEDTEFIYDSWLKSYRDSKAHKLVRKEFYYRGHSNKIDAIVSRQGTRVVVAANTDDAGHLFGYVVFELLPGGHNAVLHYIYVKQSYRRRGLGRHLLEVVESAGELTTMSHYPPSTEVYRYFKKKGEEYDPYKQ